jgi:hypothetical protein
MKCEPDESDADRRAWRHHDGGQFIVVSFTYPETKGQTLEELQRKLGPVK